ncbi:MAG: type II toxin-antitoxin system Phd/YefM family antitoxin [Chloroflexi bacterium]|nr:type II toxin-antitoxin system Phd/YefM family antitoxin [Chloroflexota bacterium]
MQRKIEGMVRDGVGVRELKANPSEILKLLEENPGLEFVITRYGKPSAKLVSLRGQKEEVPWEERINMRNAWANLHELSDEDFLEAKGIWGPKDDPQS